MLNSDLTTIGVQQFNVGDLPEEQQSALQKVTEEITPELTLLYTACSIAHHSWFMQIERVLVIYLLVLI